jgi:hypothetical protein
MPLLQGPELAATVRWTCVWWHSTIMRHAAWCVLADTSFCSGLHGAGKRLHQATGVQDWLQEALVSKTGCTATRSCTCPSTRSKSPCATVQTSLQELVHVWCARLLSQRAACSNRPELSQGRTRPPASMTVTIVDAGCTALTLCSDVSLRLSTGVRHEPGCNLVGPLTCCPCRRTELPK